MTRTPSDDDGRLLGQFGSDWLYARRAGAGRWGPAGRVPGLGRGQPPARPQSPLRPPGIRRGFDLAAHPVDGEPDLGREQVVDVELCHAARLATGGAPALGRLEVCVELRRT